MATIEDIKKVLEEEIKPLRSKLLIRFLISFLLVVLFVHFYCPFAPANFMKIFYTSYVHIYIFTILFKPFT